MKGPTSSRGLKEEAPGTRLWKVVHERKSWTLSFILSLRETIHKSSLFYLRNYSLQITKQ